MANGREHDALKITPLSKKIKKKKDSLWRETGKITTTHLPNNPDTKPQKENTTQRTNKKTKKTKKKKSSTFPCHSSTPMHLKSNKYKK